MLDFANLLRKKSCSSKPCAQIDIYLVSCNSCEVYNYKNIPSLLLFLTMRSTPAFAGPPSFSPDLHYFSYGSNMSRKKMSTRGESDTPPIEFEASYLARLPDFRLTFDFRGSVPHEPAMASIEAAPGDETFGLAYKIKDARSWNKLLRSEGVEGHCSTYIVINAVAQCFDQGFENPPVVREVVTLMTRPTLRCSKWLEYETYPSKRYMNIILSAAKEEKLPPHYIDRLTTIPTARLWPDSKLLRLIDIVTPLFYLSLNYTLLGILTWPLRAGSFRLYRAHENIVRRDMLKLSLMEKVFKSGILLMMYLLFCLYFPSSFILFMVWTRYRFVYHFVQQQRASAEVILRREEGQDVRQENRTDAE